jgi:peroxiredoxin
MSFFRLLILVPFLLFNSILTEQEPKVGDLVANFSLKSTEGKVISMENKASIKGYIIVFTSNSCPYSTLYEDRIAALHNKYSVLGFPVLAIQPNNPKTSPEDSFEKMKQKKDEKAFPFSYLMDTSDQETAKAFGATNTPQAFVVQKTVENTFKIEYIGAIDNNSRNPEEASKRYVEIAVEELLENQPVTTKNTKAIGCTIKN